MVIKKIKFNDIYLDFLDKPAAIVFNELMLRAKELKLNIKGIKRTIKNYSNLGLDLKDYHPTDYVKVYREALSEYIISHFDSIEARKNSVVPNKFQESLDGFQKINIWQSMEQNFTATTIPQAKEAYRTVTIHQEDWVMAINSKKDNISDRYN